jgi:putative ABC transport system substrate-binding protein
MQRRTVEATSRRSLLKASAAAWLGTRLAIAKAQNNMRRVALLGIFDGPNPNADLFRSRLGELGWVEHKTLILDRRFTHADGARFAPLTAELLALRPDVFVAPFDTMATAAATATATVPIVFAIGTDPIEYGLVEITRPPRSQRHRLQRRPPRAGEEWLSPLKEAVPRLKVVDVLVGSRDRYKVEYLEEARRQLGLELVQFELTKSPRDDQLSDC